MMLHYVAHIASSWMKAPCVTFQTCQMQQQLPTTSPIIFYSSQNLSKLAKVIQDLSRTVIHAQAPIKAPVWKMF